MEEAESDRARQHHEEAQSDQARQQEEVKVWQGRVEAMEQTEADRARQHEEAQSELKRQQEEMAAGRASDQSRQRQEIANCDNSI